MCGCGATYMTELFKITFYEDYNVTQSPLVTYMTYNVS
jgi:hypothetical protein